MTARKSTTSIFLKAKSGISHTRVPRIQVAGLPKARFNPAKRLLDEDAFVKSLVASISHTATELARFESRIK